MRIKFGDILYIKGRIGWQKLSKDEYLENGDYYLVTGVDITDECRIDFSRCYYVNKERYDMDDKIQLKNGDIIVTKDGTIGKIAIIENMDKPATLNSHLFLIRNNRTDILDNIYLFYILRSDYFQKFAANNTSGSNIPAFTQENISKFEMDLPSLDIQKRIANALATIDSKLRLNNSICSDLEAMAKTIYDYWFVQFNFPNEEGKPYKSSGGKMVWNEELKREIPEGWESTPFGDILNFSKGKIPNGLSDKKTDEYTTPYITIDVANQGMWQFCSEKKMVECNGETIMVMDGAASGDIYIGNKGVLGSTFAKLSSIRTGVSDALIYRLLKANDVIYKKANTGSTVPHANRSFIENMCVAIPNDCSSYSETFNKMNAQVINLQSENRDLTSLRDFLLPMLMNGQVKIGKEGA